MRGSVAGLLSRPIFAARSAVAPVARITYRALKSPCSVNQPEAVFRLFHVRHGRLDQLGAEMRRLPMPGVHQIGASDLRHAIEVVDHRAPGHSLVGIDEKRLLPALQRTVQRSLPQSPPTTATS